MSSPPRFFRHRAQRYRRALLEQLEGRRLLASLQVFQDQLRFSAAPGETNNVTVAVVSQSGQDYVRFTDAGISGLVARTGVEPVGDNAAQVPLAGLSGIEVLLDDGDDHLAIAIDLRWPETISLKGGPGADQITIIGSAAGDHILLASSTLDIGAALTVDEIESLSFDLQAGDADVITVDHEVSRIVGRVSIDGDAEDDLEIVSNSDTGAVFDLQDNDVTLMQRPGSGLSFIGEARVYEQETHLELQFVNNQLVICELCKNGFGLRRDPDTGLLTETTLTTDLTDAAPLGASPDGDLYAYERSTEQEFSVLKPSQDRPQEFAAVQTVSYPPLALAPASRTVSSPDGSIVILEEGYSVAHVFRRNVSTGTLSRLQGNVPHGGLSIAPDARHMYEIYQGKVLAYSIGENTVTKISEKSFPLVGNDAQAMVISPDGRFVYVASGDARTLTVLRRNPVDGELQPHQVLQDDDIFNASTMTIDPTGDRIYVAPYSKGRIVVLKRDATTGRVEVIDRVDNVKERGSLTIAPDGRHLYAPYTKTFSNPRQQGYYVFATGVMYPQTLTVSASGIGHVEVSGSPGDDLFRTHISSEPGPDWHIDARAGDDTFELAAIDRLDQAPELSIDGGTGENRVAVYTTFDESTVDDRQVGVTADAELSSDYQVSIDSFQLHLKNTAEFEYNGDGDNDDRLRFHSVTSFPWLTLRDRDASIDALFGEEATSIANAAGLTTFAFNGMEPKVTVEGNSTSTGLAHLLYDGFGSPTSSRLNTESGLLVNHQDLRSVLVSSHRWNLRDSRDSELTLRRVGSDSVLSLDENVLLEQPTASLALLQLESHNSELDTLDIDYSTGSPLPTRIQLAEIGELNFEGGRVGRARYTIAHEHAATIEIDDEQVELRGVLPVISDKLRARRRDLKLNDAGNRLDIQQVEGSLFQLGLEGATVFTAPATEHFSIETLGRDDLITMTPLASAASSHLAPIVDIDMGFGHQDSLTLFGSDDDDTWHLAERTISLNGASLSLSRIESTEIDVSQGGSDQLVVVQDTSLGNRQVTIRGAGPDDSLWGTTVADGVTRSIDVEPDNLRMANDRRYETYEYQQVIRYEFGVDNEPTTHSMVGFFHQFTPQRRHAYSLGWHAEKRAGLLAWERDATTGSLTPVEIWTSTPALHSDLNVAEIPDFEPSALLLSPDGLRLYVATDRGLSVFSRDRETGQLQLVTRQDGVFGDATRLAWSGEQRIVGASREAFYFADLEANGSIAGHSTIASAPDPETGVTTPLSGLVDFDEVQFSPRGEYVIVRHRLAKTMLFKFDRVEHKVVRSQLLDRDDLNVFAFSNDESRLYAGSDFFGDHDVLQTYEIQPDGRVFLKQTVDLETRLLGFTDQGQLSVKTNSREVLFDLDVEGKLLTPGTTRPTPVYQGTAARGHWNDFVYSPDARFAYRWPGVYERQLADSFEVRAAGFGQRGIILREGENNVRVASELSTFITTERDTLLMLQDQSQFVLNELPESMKFDTLDLTQTSVINVELDVASVVALNGDQTLIVQTDDESLQLDGRWRIQKTVVEGEAYDRLTRDDATVLWSRPGLPWHNPIQALDVSGDGLVSPIDALLTINHLNLRSDSELPSPNEMLLHYLDTNGDGKASPFDTLLVINHLNRVDDAEGEALHLLRYFFVGFHFPLSSNAKGSGSTTPTHGTWRKGGGSPSQFGQEAESVRVAATDRAFALWDASSERHAWHDLEAFLAYNEDCSLSSSTLRALELPGS